MSVTQAQIDALNEAISQAERQVTNGAQTVTYRSIADLIAARDDLRRQLANQAQPERPRRTYLTYGGRGY